MSGGPKCTIDRTFNITFSLCPHRNPKSYTTNLRDASALSRQDSNQSIADTSIACGDIAQSLNGNQPSELDL
jgi:hypothetical protein